MGAFPRLADRVQALLLGAVPYGMTDAQLLSGVDGKVGGDTAIILTASGPSRDERSAGASALNKKVLCWTGKAQAEICCREDRGPDRQASGFHRQGLGSRGAALSRSLSTGEPGRKVSNDLQEDIQNGSIVTAQTADSRDVCHRADAQIMVIHTSDTAAVRLSDRTCRQGQTADARPEALLHSVVAAKLK
ncbi:hypothetical protein TREES_T100010831 [Tupaia chinensis]|uniref:Uncharacterized protein n=1 Tax=Tupaia chinensis TaxID=246437 RepID=L9KHX5_TUPCH|nr:hypothetical protein TREES_T100010831 [Tupaia chinensis]